MSSERQFRVVCTIGWVVWVAVVSVIASACGNPGPLPDVRDIHDVVSNDAAPTPDGARADAGPSWDSSFDALSDDTADASSADEQDAPADATMPIDSPDAGSGEASPPPPVDAGPGTSATIGSTGGELDSPDGARVIIPPGALASDTVITIRRIDPPSGAGLPLGSTLAGPVFDLTPDGQQFTVPVTIVLPYDPTLTTPETALPAVQSADGNFHPAADAEAESPRYTVDAVAHVVNVQSTHFCAWAVIDYRMFASIVASTPVTTLTAPSGASVQVHRLIRTVLIPETAGTYSNRAPSQVQYLVIHTTDGSNTSGCTPAPAGASYSACCTGPGDSDLGTVYWAITQQPIGAPGVPCTSGVCDCTGVRGAFAHFYVGRDGTIYQLAETDGPDSVVPHVGTDAANAVSVGIEIIHSGHDGVPEQAGYPGAQIAAVERLSEYLIEKYGIPRRDPASPIVEGTGLTASGPFVLGHREADTRAGAHHDPPSTFPWQALLGALHNGTSGVIDTSGGAAMVNGVGGFAGAVSFSASSSTTASNTCGVTTLSTAVLSGSYGDVVIDAATPLVLGADVMIQSTGSVYVTPRTVIRTVGHAFTIDAQGSVVIDGAIDARGPDGTTATPDGAHGGTVMVDAASGGPWLVPSIVARGGENFDNATTAAGSGGDVSIGRLGASATDGWILFSGGAIVASAPRPDFGSSAIFTIEPPTLSPTARQGIVTSGGSGGASQSVYMVGGRGGDGGNVTIDAGPGTIVAHGYRIMTGADTDDPTTAILSTYVIDTPRTGFPLAFPTGSNGGRGGVAYGTITPANGGTGGAAGTIRLSGAIRGFDPARVASISISRLDGQHGDTGAAPNAHATQLYDVDGSDIVTLSAAGGSGGPSGAYSTSASYGYAGAAGTNGTIVVNGTAVPVSP